MVIDNIIDKLKDISLTGWSVNQLDCKLSYSSPDRGLNFVIKDYHHTFLGFRKLKLVVDGRLIKLSFFKKRQFNKLALHKHKCIELLNLADYQVKTFTIKTNTTITPPISNRRDIFIPARGESFIGESYLNMGELDHSARQIPSIESRRFQRNDSLATRRIMDMIGRVEQPLINPQNNFGKMDKEELSKKYILEAKNRKFKEDFEKEKERIRKILREKKDKEGKQ